MPENSDSIVRRSVAARKAWRVRKRMAQIRKAGEDRREPQDGDQDVPAPTLHPAKGGALERP